MFEPQSIWCGSLPSYDSVVKAADETVAEFDMPSLLSKAGTSSVVSISGPLINGDAGFMAFFGITGYNDVRSALVEAAQDPETTSIVLDIDSPGGQVAGVDDLAAFIKQVQQYKPVVAYSGGMMASAAYWLGSSAENVVVSPTSDVGSIGVLAVHTEYSKAYEQEGIKKTVIRAGEMKAVTNSIEPLSESGRKVLTESVNETYDIFWSRVADNRGFAETARQQVAEGRVFSGNKAAQAGLADDVGSFEDALALAAALADERAGKKRTDNLSGLVGNKAAGVVVSPHNAAQESSTMTTRAQLSPNDTSVLATLRAEMDLAIVAKVGAEVKAKELADTFETRLAEAQAAVALQLDEATAKAQASTELADKFKAIVSLSANNMAIACNEAALPADATVEQILAAHADLETKFKAKFKSGGIVATAPAAETEVKTSTTVDPVFAMMAKSIPNR
jgi:signal peptide peptidase SppA